MDIASGALEDKLDVVARAAALAVKAHGDQQYGIEPYVAHLVSVTQNLHRFETASRTLLAAAWLHDAVEDTDLSLDEIRAHIGDKVAELVHAVTSEKGVNRKERNSLTYPKILAVPQATILKLADRIANVESCWATRDAKLFMYQREYRDFRSILRKEGQDALAFSASPEGRMWRHLDVLLGWWEPK